MHFEILPKHDIIVTKCSHPVLRECLPADRTTPITIEHGRKLAAWCASAGQPATPKVPGKDELKKELWNLTKLKHGGEPAKLEQWLWDEMLLDPALKLADLDTPTMAAIIKLAKGKL